MSRWDYPLVAALAALSFLSSAWAGDGTRSLEDRNVFELQIDVQDSRDATDPEVQRQQLLAHDNLLNVEVQALKEHLWRLVGVDRDIGARMDAEERILRALWRRHEKEEPSWLLPAARRIVGHQVIWYSKRRAVGLVVVSDIDSGGMPEAQEYDVLLSGAFGSILRIAPRE